MAERPLCVLIGALGGQGGGVLADWLVDAARAAGYPAQATSIPGVAQRTGATTYYFELYPEIDPPLEPVFSLFPGADDLDLVVAMEPTEAGRALEKGWVTERTTVISTTQRIYSTSEKSLAGDGRVDPLPVLDALAQASRALVLIETDPLAQSNAMMLGAIAGTGILPLSEAQLRDAIVQRGLAVDSNLEAFASGFAMAGAPRAEPTETDSLSYDPAPVGFESGLRELPVEIHPIVGHGLARLLDYQNREYAHLYLNRMHPIVAIDSADRGYRLSVATARRLAAWMSYEDVMRVAQLKTRPGRLARIRSEIGASESDPILVYDYFKPRLHEIRAIMPRPFGGWMRGLSEQRPGTGIRLRWPTATPLGYASLKLLAWLRRWRGRGAGYRQEQDAIEAWLGAIRSAAAVDYELALASVELAVWARGYGEVRQRGLDHIAGFCEQWQQRLATDPAALQASLERSLRAAREDPEHAPPP